MSETLARPTAFDVLTAPITVVVGHFGSGKTEIALNLAVGWAGRGETVSIVDLDLVKPYFRSRLLREELTAKGITLVAPRGDQFYADLPILVPEVRGAIGDAAAGRRRVILDVGGADVGSRVLGSLSGLDDPRLTDVLFVVNGRRPFAEDSPSVVRMLRDIEQASKLRVTGLVANTHLMDETTTDVVRAGIELADAVGRDTGLPVRFFVVPASMAGSIASAIDDREWPLLPLNRLITPPFDVRAPGMRRRSSVV